MLRKMGRPEPGGCSTAPMFQPRHQTLLNDRLRYLCPGYRYQPQLGNDTAVTPNVQAVPMVKGVINYLAFFRGLGSGVPVAYEMCSPLLHGGEINS